MNTGKLIKSQNWNLMNFGTHCQTLHNSLFGWSIIDMHGRVAALQTCGLWNIGSDVFRIRIWYEAYNFDCGLETLKTAVSMFHSIRLKCFTDIVYTQWQTNQRTNGQSFAHDSACQTKTQSSHSKHIFYNRYHMNNVFAEYNLIIFTSTKLKASSLNYLDTDHRLDRTKRKYPDVWRE